MFIMTMMTRMFIMTMMTKPPPALQPAVPHW
jgi:hypothetical protein